MTNFQDTVILAALESLLAIKFRPTFLALTINQDDGIIQVVMSCLNFNHQSINERTISVFNEINRELPQLIDEHLIVLQCFNSEEIERVIDDLFQEELTRWM